MPRLDLGQVHVALVSSPVNKGAEPHHHLFGS